MMVTNCFVEKRTVCTAWHCWLLCIAVLCVCVMLQVVEYDRPSVLLENHDSAFSRLMEASQVDDATDNSAVVHQTADSLPSTTASVWCELLSHIDQIIQLSHLSPCTQTVAWQYIVIRGVPIDVLFSVGQLVSIAGSVHSSDGICKYLSCLSSVTVHVTRARRAGHVRCFALH